MAQEQPTGVVPPAEKVEKHRYVSYEDYVAEMRRRDVRFEERERYWRDRLAGAEGALKGSSKELHFLRNAYPDLSYVFKGQMKFSLNSFKNAITIVDYWFGGYKSLWGIHRLIHQRKYPPLWQLVLMAAGLITLVALLANPSYYGPAISENRYVILGALALVLVIFVIRNRKKDKPVQ